MMAYFNRGSRDLPFLGKRSNMEDEDSSSNFSKRQRFGFRMDNRFDKGNMSYSYSHLLAGDSFVSGLYDGICKYVEQKNESLTLFKMERRGQKSDQIIQAIGQELIRETIVDDVHYPKYEKEVVVILVTGNCDLYSKSNEALLSHSISAEQLGSRIVSLLLELKSNLGKKIDPKFIVVPAFPRPFKEAPAINLIDSFNKGLATTVESIDSITHSISILPNFEKIFKTGCTKFFDQTSHPTETCCCEVVNLIMKMVDGMISQDNEPSTAMNKLTLTDKTADNTN